MIRILPDQGLSYDDVLIVPNKSGVNSRKEVSLTSRVFGDRYIPTPIISANMDTVTEVTMAHAMYHCSGLGIIHRYNEKFDRIGQIAVLEGIKVLAIGLNEEWPDDFFKNTLFDAILIDVAHGHHQKVIDLVKRIKSLRKDLYVIAGNIATFDAAYDLLQAGTDSLKVGIGPGDACITRMVTGCGVPQLTAIQEVRKAIEQWWKHYCVYFGKKTYPPDMIALNQKHKPTLIADGGIKNSGDIVKALAFGADTVMLGSLLSGTDETPGEIIEDEYGNQFKEYRGMASREAQKTIGKTQAPEGISKLIPHKGSVKDVMKDLCDGIRSGLSYCGAISIEDLRTKEIEIIKVSRIK